MQTWTGLVLRRGRLFAMAAAMAFLPGVAEAQTIQRERITNALPRLEAMIDRIIAAKEVPGLSIAIIHDDEVVYRKGFGLREIGKPDMVGADTVFQIASLSKPVSSTVVAALVGEGIVSWDSRLADIDPAFRFAEAYPTSMVTIRDLFAHRSGLPGGAGDDLEEIGYGRDEILQRLRLLPPASSFRSAYAYSNFGLTAGAVAACEADGPILGGCRRGETLPTAWDDIDKLPACGLSRATGSGCLAHQGQWRLGREGAAQSGPAGAGRRSQLHGRRSGKLGTPGTRPRNVRREAPDRRRCPR